MKEIRTIEDVKKYKEEAINDFCKKAGASRAELLVEKTENYEEYSYTNNNGEVFTLSIKKVEDED